MKRETIALHAGYQSEPTTKSAAVPILPNHFHTFDNTQHGADLFNLDVAGDIYTRMMNPTTAVWKNALPVWKAVSPHWLSPAVWRQLPMPFKPWLKRATTSLQPKPSTAAHTISLLTACRAKA